METSRTRHVFFFLLLGLVGLLFLYVLKPFFYPIFWAVIISSIIHPLYVKLFRRWPSPNLLSSFLLLFLLLILILPTIFVGSILVSQSMSMYNTISSDTSHIARNLQDLTGRIANHPYIERFNIDQAFWMGKLSEILRSISNYIFTRLSSLTQNTLVVVAQFAVMLYTLFFFIRDGDKLLETAIRLIPLGNERERMLFDRFINTAKSTLKVTLIIGGLQGMLGALAFWIAGVEGSMLWGVIMIATAIIPGVGCSIVWAPAGIIMLITGHTWEGVMILAVGAFLISLVDNLLRPILLGKDVQMHPLLIFLSSLGGIVLFGFSGFVLGPIIASLMQSVCHMYEQLYRDTSVPE
jgi:predicted PurR-regulated permease PerM